MMSFKNALNMWTICQAWCDIQRLRVSGPQEKTQNEKGPRIAPDLCLAHSSISQYPVDNMASPLLDRATRLSTTGCFPLPLLKPSQIYR